MAIETLKTSANTPASMTFGASEKVKKQSLLPCAAAGGLVFGTKNAFCLIKDCFTSEKDLLKRATDLCNNRKALSLFSPDDLKNFSKMKFLGKSAQNLAFAVLGGAVLTWGILKTFGSMFGGEE